MKKREPGDFIGHVMLIEKVGAYSEPSGKRRDIWKCLCNCGTVLEVRSKNFHSAISCYNCIKRRALERSSRRVVTLESKHRSRYNHMIARCYDPDEIGYENYGGRGIQVCDRWRCEGGLTNFCEDMGECPENYTLDRIDVNGDYSPENCRWATKSTQGFNTRQHKTNTSGRTGVYWFARVNKWIAAIIKDNKQIHLGYFLTIESAVAAREKAEIELFGELRPEASDNYAERIKEKQ